MSNLSHFIHNYWLRLVSMGQVGSYLDSEKKQKITQEISIAQIFFSIYYFIYIFFLIILDWATLFLGDRFQWQLPLISSLNYYTSGVSAFCRTKHLYLLRKTYPKLTVPVYLPTSENSDVAKYLYCRVWVLWALGNGISRTVWRHSSGGRVTVPSRTTGFSVPICLTYGLFASRRSLGSLACSVAGSAVFRQHLGGLLAVLE